jgi:hypothetical protein
VPSIHASGAAHGSWESYGPEQAIHLCEVRITAYNYTMGLSALLYGLDHGVLIAAKN